MPLFRSPDLGTGVPVLPSSGYGEPTDTMNAPNQDIEDLIQRKLKKKERFTVEDMDMGVSPVSFGNGARNAATRASSGISGVWDKPERKDTCTSCNHSDCGCGHQEGDVCSCKMSEGKSRKSGAVSTDTLPTKRLGWIDPSGKELNAPQGINSHERHANLLKSTSGDLLDKGYVRFVHTPNHLMVHYSKANTAAATNASKFLANNYYGQHITVDSQKGIDYMGDFGFDYYQGEKLDKAIQHIRSQTPEMEQYITSDNMIDTVLEGFAVEDVVRTALDEVSPPGWEGTVKGMKKHKNVRNPWALAWYMKGKGAK